MEWGGENVLFDIVALIICTSRVVNMKEYLAFCGEFSILYIEEKELLLAKRAALKDSAF